MKSGGRVAGQLRSYGGAYRGRHSGPFDDDINQRRDGALAIVEGMLHIGETAAAVTRLKHHRIGSENGTDLAGRKMHVLDGAARMGGKRSGHGMRRHVVAHELDAAAGQRRREAVAACAAGRIDDRRPLAGADDMDTSRRRRSAVDESRQGHP